MIQRVSLSRHAAAPRRLSATSLLNGGQVANARASDAGPGAGLAYAAGLNLYATVAIIGLAVRFGWIGPLPGSPSVRPHGGSLGLRSSLTSIEFLAIAHSGVASAWDTLHSPDPSACRGSVGRRHSLAR